MGTGGAPFDGLPTAPASCEGHGREVLGALRRVLRPTGDDCRVVPVARRSVRDAVIAACHGVTRGNAAPRWHPRARTRCGVSPLALPGLRWVEV